MAYQKKRVGEVDDDRLKFETSTVISKEVTAQNFFNVEFGKRWKCSNDYEGLYYHYVCPKLNLEVF